MPVSCSHSWLSVGETSDAVYAWEFWQGPIEALLSCNQCKECALIRLLDWQGANLETRVYSIAMVPNLVRDTFLRNMRSDYCDLARKQQEVEALINAAPISHIGLFTLPTFCLEKLKAHRSPLKHPHWQHLNSSKNLGAWFK